MDLLLAAGVKQLLCDSASVKHHKRLRKEVEEISEGRIDEGQLRLQKARVGLCNFVEEFQEGTGSKLTEPCIWVSPLGVCSEDH